MFADHRTRRLAFTLVEMLVVLGIIGVLIAILLPVIGSALVTTRNARMAIEIAQLRDAVEAYKNAHGDYPPSFGEWDPMMGTGTMLYGDPMKKGTTIVERHLQRCYPKMTVTAKNALYAKAAAPTRIDQGEALVLWLSKVGSNVTDPFDPSSTPTPLYDFKPNQLFDEDGDGLFAYRGAYSKEASYIYIDSRTYAKHVPQGGNDYPARAESVTSLPLTAQVRPYYQATNLFVNKTSFQILCAGQDGEFSDLSPGTIPLKQFPQGTNYTEADRDNITSFSEGKTLGNSIPQ